MLSGAAAVATGADATPADLEPSAVTPVGGSAAATPITILLMGDSYTAGNGARNELGERSYYGPAKCMRSSDTWGEQYASFLGEQGFAVTLLNRACSAATTDNMLNERYLKRTDVLAYPDPEPVDAPRTFEFYADWAATQPVCTPVPNSEEHILVSISRGALHAGKRDVTVSCAHWLRPQVEALNPDVDLVLFTVGGNDAHFPDIMRACLVMGSMSGCEEAIEVAESYVTEEFASDLGRVFDEMYERTEGNTKVVYLGYPRLEASADLVLTAVVNGQVKQLPVAAELDRLIALGAQAQRQAVDAANARYGGDFVVFLDGLPELFAGHEPDARPGVANPDRWIAEAFETNMKDEWYHFRPEGQAAIAEYVSGFGTFGVAGDVPARDLAFVTDGSPAALGAMAYAARKVDFGAARVSIVEQRLDADGVGVERRLVASGLDADGVAEWAANRTDDLSGWRSASEFALEARWNAAQQVIYVGDATVGVDQLDTVFSGERQGLRVAPSIAIIDTGRGPLAIDADYTYAPAAPAGPVVEALITMARAPHAWAGGPYTAPASGAVTLDASGSFGAGPLAYAWDLDGDGTFERTSDGPRISASVEAVHVGWVGVRVTSADGIETIARAWVFPPADAMVSLGMACVTEGGLGSFGGGTAGGAGTTAGGGDACQPLGASARWIDDTTAEGGLIQPSASAEADSTVVLAWIANPELYNEPRELRSLTVTVRSGSRASSPSRRRPRQLVRRERGLQVLVDAPAVLTPAARAEAAGFALAA